MYTDMVLFVWQAEASAGPASGSSPKGEDFWKNAKSIYEFQVKDIDGNELSLDKYKLVLPTFI